MDNHSPPDSTSPTPSVSASSAASSKQPTYTTAGTIYKPSSSQPLQPPTRRGRSLKWPIGSSLHADLVALPKTALSELKASAGGSYSALQQYTPLQQNYDRAISPFSNQDHIHANMPADMAGIQFSAITNFQLFGMSEPKIRKRVLKTEGELFSGNYSDADDGQDGDKEDGDDDDDDDEDDDDDDGANNNALKNLPVQSLKHLASYSNPTQKAAQKAFQRGSRTRPSTLHSSMGSGLSTSPPGLASSHCPDAPCEGAQGLSGTKNLLQADFFALKRAQHDLLSKIDSVWSTRNRTPAPPLSLPPRAKSASIEISKSSQKHILGKNMPMPLTAGPPGQRQFRPLNFEKALKALNYAQSSSATHSEEEGGAPLTANHKLRKHGVEDFRVVPEVLDTLPTAATLNTAFKPRSHAVQLQGIQLPSGIIDSEEESCSTFHTIPAPASHTKVRKERPAGYTGWRDSPPKAPASRRPGSYRLTDEALEAHNRKLEAWWYSGVSKAYRRPETTNLRRPSSLKDHGFGAVGDNRPTALVGRVKTLNMEEASAIPASECTRSLMEMIIIARSSHNADHCLSRRCSPAFFP